MDSLKTEKIRVPKQADVFIARTAITTRTSSDIVEKIVTFQFKDLLKALRTVSTVEISGFGRMYISQAKLKKRIERDYLNRSYLQDKVLSEKDEYKIKSYLRSLDKLRDELIYLESKIIIKETKPEDGHSVNMGGMAQSPDASREVKGAN
jgi:hypothetical protein